MIAMKIVLDGEGILEQYDPTKILHVTEEITVTALAGGMTSGSPSVALIIPIGNGQVVLIETSMKLFQVAAMLFAARYGWQIPITPEPKS